MAYIESGLVKHCYGDVCNSKRHFRRTGLVWQPKRSRGNLVRFQKMDHHTTMPFYLWILRSPRIHSGPLTALKLTFYSGSPRWRYVKWYIELGSYFTDTPALRICFFMRVKFAGLWHIACSQRYSYPQIMPLCLQYHRPPSATLLMAQKICLPGARGSTFSSKDGDLM